MASNGHYGQCAARIEPGLISRIRFGSVLPKMPLIILHKTGPDPIGMVWSDFGQIHLVWKQASVQESSGPFLAEHNQPSASFPEMARNILCKTSPDLIWLWLADCVRFWPNGSGLEANQCTRIIGPTSG